jgi:hypothetical protein
MGRSRGERGARARSALRFSALVLALATLAVSAPAPAAAAPALGVTWASDVLASTAKLHGTVNPNGVATTYRFDYLPEAAYEANLANGKDGFLGASRTPKVEAALGSGTSAIPVAQTASGLVADTTYRYRLRALSVEGIFTTAPGLFVTQAAPGGSLLADGRGWEMVSPVDKNGGQIDPPGAILGGGVLQAAADGQAVTYGSAASFGPGAQGAPPASQYLGRRVSGGWTTENLTVPLFSGSYGRAPEGVPYRLFSGDLARGLLLNGRHCRGEAGGCAVANPPLPGTGAPAGYQDYYLRETATGGFQALVGAADVAQTPLEPAELELVLAGASPDLRHVVLSTCAALTADAVEAPLGEGCDPARPNLYEWSAGAGLRLVNLLPGASEGDPGAALGAQAGAVCADGSRVYWTDLSSGNLYLREGGETRQVDAAAGGGGAFQTATPDGSLAFFTRGGHLWRHDAALEESTDLTPAGGVTGVLGASADGAHLYYATAAGLHLHTGGEATQVAGPVDASNYPPATGAARLSADGTRLVFRATAPLTGYDNADAVTGLPDSQVYLYDAALDELTCVSCNPTNGRPSGPSSIPGASANGEGPNATVAYKPRVLAAGGRRVFFDSRDALVLADTNADADVYQWEAEGTGSCARAGGCVSLISSGRAEGGASFADASADGADAFFLTDGSLVKSDPGSVDLYDARVGGGFPEPEEGIPCNGNACQGLLSEPVDPPLNTLLPGLGNPPVHYAGQKKPCKKGKVRRHGRCVKKAPRQRKGQQRRPSRAGGR